MNADKNQAVLTERIIGALVEVSNTRGSGFLARESEPPNTYGIGYPIPVAIEGLPAYVAMIVNDHLLNYPSSDLMDVLTGKESFQEALQFPQFPSAKGGNTPAPSTTVHDSSPRRLRRHPQVARNRPIHPALSPVARRPGSEPDLRPPRSPAAELPAVREPPRSPQEIIIAAERLRHLTLRSWCASI